MNKYAWIGSGFAAMITLLTVSACDDYEFQHEECTEHWDCRTNFGIGYTCNSDGFCEEPSENILREYCSNTQVNYPPEIFSSVSARRSLTLGTMVDVAGQQLASAARIAMELSNIRGGVGGVTPLGAYNFSVVSCVLSDSDAANERTVREVARFLRDEVRAEAVLLGMTSSATLQAVQELRDRDAAAGENGHTLIISANDSTFEFENRLKDQNQLWTMAASESSMLKHAGVQLVLRRLHPYAMAFCVDGDGNPLPDNTCQYEEPGEDEEPPTLVEIDTLSDLLARAYRAYNEDHGGDESALGSYRVESFLPTDSTSGQAADGARREAFSDGVDRALEYVRGDETSIGTFERGFETNMLACGESCGPKQIQVELLKKMGCEGSSLRGDGVVDVDEDTCGEDYQTDLSAVLLLADSGALSQAFYRAILGADGTTEDPVAARIAKVVGVNVPEISPPASGYTAETIFMMPAAASSGSMGVYTYDYASSAYNDSQSIRKRWFSYIEDGRIFGLRQTANPDAPAYDEFQSAQSILVRENVGATQHYITQAYDAVWLSMAAIAASVVSMPQDVNVSAAEQMTILRERTAQTHATSLRKHFSGATPDELETLNIPRADQMTYVERDFIPSQWEKIVDTRRSTEEDLNGFEYPVLQNTYALTGASGKLRFDVATGVNSNATPRKRGAYNYGVWILATQDKLVSESKANVDLDARGCIVGMAAPIGKTVEELPDPTSADYDRHKFVCAVEAANCTYDNKDTDNEICVPTHPNGRMLGYTFPNLAP